MYLESGSVIKNLSYFLAKSLKEEFSFCDFNKSENTQGFALINYLIYLKIK